MIPSFGPIHDARISLPYGRYGIEVQIDSVSGDRSKILGGHQSRIRQMCYGNFGTMQTVYAPRNRDSAGRKFLPRVIGSGCGFCNQIGTTVELRPTHLTGKIRSSFQDQGVQYLPPNLAGRDSMF